MKYKKGGDMSRQIKTKGRQSNSAAEDREGGAAGEDFLKMLLGLQAAFSS